MSFFCGYPFEDPQFQPCAVEMSSLFLLERVLKVVGSKRSVVQAGSRKNTPNGKVRLVSTLQVAGLIRPPQSGPLAYQSKAKPCGGSPGPQIRLPSISNWHGRPGLCPLSQVAGGSTTAAGGGSSPAGRPGVNVWARAT